MCWKHVRLKDILWVCDPYLMTLFHHSSPLRRNAAAKTNNTFKRTERRQRKLSRNSAKSLPSQTKGKTKPTHKPTQKKENNAGVIRRVEDEEMKGTMDKIKRSNVNTSEFTAGKRSTKRRPERT